MDTQRDQRDAPEAAVAAGPRVPESGQVAPGGDRPPAPPPPDSAWRVLLRHMRQSWRPLLLGGVLGLLASVIGLVLPLVVRRLVDDLGADRPVAGVLLLMGALVVLSAAAGPLGEYVLRRAGESIVLTARRRLISHLMRLRISAFDSSEPGDLMSRVTSDTTLIRQVAADSLIGGITGGVALVATATMMGVLDPVLLVVTLGVLAVAGTVLRLIMPQVQRASQEVQQSVGLMGAALERVLGALRTVKASGAEQREGAAVHRAAEESWRSSVRAAKWLALAGNTGELAIQLAFFTVLAVGGARVTSGAIDVGTLIAFLMYVYFLIGPLQLLIRAFGQYQVGAAAITRLQEAERLPAEPENPPAPLPAPETAPASLEFRDVHFRYAPDLPLVHRGVTFSVPARGMTAFVGPSGAGKTTLFSLIERFYEPTSGSILLNGRDVGAWDLPELRAMIGYVEQDAPVLSGSLRENLLLGAPDASDDEMRRVLRTTRLDDLVERLPNGLDSLLGSRGTKLSGGERQRVAIARALLRRPRLLLLDEATSQLDAVNEAALRKTVTEVARTTTVLVVAHRLSTVTQADRIVVVDAGTILAIGTHAELIEAEPLYAELATTQFLPANHR
ncbi:ATP-binding cassette subfamily C protein [Streptosporangium becharense]|uniref:ATP-binding cassette subfamily C protein n=1 Tax=Streptosporangium becharense TaxID=1816182 RepID=A0A7W9MHA2_9ACTN|nr:ABC transporter ATP-binding protein [Streptosporangium becharense]MBB2914945.1 ATP-binding cassette subfamily C protein [Streptosporangium becharense]MBB5820244.1 ATP-binding cassette subfamily C protein [Streptosporangium becharense]